MTREEDTMQSGSWSSRAAPVGTKVAPGACDEHNEKAHRRLS